jgi:hypothetical protein
MDSGIFDWKNGQVTFWVLDRLRADLALGEQVIFLREDLAQIEFPNSRLLDVGWYPTLKEDGRFIVQVIKDKNWDDPVLHVEVPSLETLREAINGAILCAAGGEV